MSRYVLTDAADRSEEVLTSVHTFEVTLTAGHTAHPARWTAHRSPQHRSPGPKSARDDRVDIRNQYTKTAPATISRPQTVAFECLGVRLQLLDPHANDRPEIFQTLPYWFSRDSIMDSTQSQTV